MVWRSSKCKCCRTKGIEKGKATVRGVYAFRNEAVLDWLQRGLTEGKAMKEGCKGMEGLQVPNIRVDIGVSQEHEEGQEPLVKKRTCLFWGMVFRLSSS